MNRAFLAATCFVLASSACRRAEHVPVLVEAPFVALTYEQALERARADDRVLLLDFTASWCGPCQAMEKTTWHEPDVTAWIERKAVALKVDIDVEFQRAERMGVSAVPTIVFVDGEGRELGRFTGYRDPAGFLAQAERCAPR